MTRHRIQMPAPRLSGLLSDVHRLATGREFQLNDALDYFGDPKDGINLERADSCLAKFEALLSELAPWDLN